MFEKPCPDLSRYARKYKWPWMEFAGGPALFSPKGRDELIAYLQGFWSCLVHAALAAAIAPAAVYGLEMMEWIRPVAAPAWIIPAFSAAAAFVSRLVIILGCDALRYYHGRESFLEAQLVLAEELLANGFQEEHISHHRIYSLDDLSELASDGDLPEKVREGLKIFEAETRTHFLYNPRAGYFSLASLAASLTVLRAHFREERRAEGKSSPWPFM